MFTSLKTFLQGLSRLFWIVVIIPTALSALYFGLIASDVYISQSKFIIYNPRSPATSTGGLSTLLSGAGFSSGAYGVYAAHDYILSRDALNDLQKSLHVETMYTGHGIDWINRFGGLLYFRKTFEEFFKYYTSRMVGVDVDPNSNISTLTVNAFTPADAKEINAQLLGQAQQLIDRLNARADAQGVAFYTKEVQQHEHDVVAAAVAMAHYRNRHRVFNPAPQSALQLQLVAKLQDKLIQQEMALAQMTLDTPRNPQIPLLKKSIAELRGEIETESANVAGAPNSLASKSVPYERLMLDQTFAEKKLAAAISALEQARIQAQKQQLFIETVVTPNLPDDALEPKRGRGVLATLVVGLMLWGVFSVIFAGVREHHDR
ncbi:lipopolysaccharide biosynthesis [Burkholderiales bacterium GJ-E10]|nr:lipopolysaccharide biosynthesis [Burkholderiales bacterium GJ-E10]